MLIGSTIGAIRLQSGESEAAALERQRQIRRRVSFLRNICTAGESSQRLVEIGDGRKLTIFCADLENKA